MIFGHDVSFWISVLGATGIKLLTSPYHSLTRALLTVFAAMFSAYVFTEPVIHWLDLDAKTYTTAMAALLALTGEGIMRALMAVANDPSKGLAWWKSLRGGQ
mgnify:CR=1 FL=1